jgi:two-component system, sensor histidine kinase and response regulator
MTDTLKILVVDDEPGMRSGVARALRDFTVRAKDADGEVGFVVEQADSGEQALSVLLPQPPAEPGRAPVDILLLDHKLPGLSGLEVLDRIAGRYDSLVTIMITAYASLETAVAAIKRVAYDFLAKPFTPSELKNTVRKAAESLLLARQARRLAAEKRQVRFQFTRVLAHELKAPLAAIEGYLHIVRDRSAGGDQAVYDHMMDRGLVRLEGMRKLIGDLLDLTRIESGQKKRELTPIDLDGLARSCIETFTPQAAEKGVSIALHGGGISMTGDRGELEIILNNLLSNAVKYNRQGGRVDLTLSARDDTVTIVAADTGVGMTAEEAGRLFVEFARIRNEKTRSILGSGLGLSIVKKLCALYDGDVTVFSTPDVGTTFTVTLKQGLQERK